MSTHLEFAKKMLKWYKEQLHPPIGHLFNKKPYKDLEEFIQADEITAADEFEAYNENSAFHEDLILMDNAICNQMELRRCMNERDIPIDVYWERWKRYLLLEQRELDKFKDIIESKHAFIKSKSKKVRADLKSFHGDGPGLLTELKEVDYVKHSVVPDTGQ